MKFEDMENMIHGNQKRIEELFILIKSIESTTVRLESSEESTITKFVSLNYKLWDQYFNLE